MDCTFVFSSNLSSPDQVILNDIVAFHSGTEPGHILAQNFDEITLIGNVLAKQECCMERIPHGDPFPTNITWYTNSSKSKKILEKIITRTGTGTKIKPNPIIWKLYEEDGVTVKTTITDEIVYNSIFETSRERTVS